MYETGNRDPDSAMGWLLERMGDPDLERSLEEVLGAKDSSASGPPPPPPELIEMVCALGFSPQQAKYALAQTVPDSDQILRQSFDRSNHFFFLAQNNDTERAVDFLFNHPEVTGEEASGDSASAAGGAGGWCFRLLRWLLRDVRRLRFFVSFSIYGHAKPKHA